MTIPAAESIGEATFKLHCRAYGLTPTAELVFDPPRKWRFDFAFEDIKLAVEIDGGTWISGRHNRGSSIEKDYEKLNRAAILGWRVLRFTTDMVENGSAIDAVLKALERVPK